MWFACTLFIAMANQKILIARSLFITPFVPPEDETELTYHLLSNHIEHLDEKPRQFTVGALGVLLCSRLHADRKRPHSRSVTNG